MTENPVSRFPSTAAPPATSAAAATITAVQSKPSLKRIQFELVTAHTAKCDLCNARNDSGMSRCSSCGWQSCHACTIKNGCTRTHNAGSRVHTGPIDQNELVENNLPKGKKKKGNGSKRVTKSQKGPVRHGREQAQTSRTQSQTQTQRGQGQGACRARTPSPSISPSLDATVSPHPFASTNSSGRQSVIASLLDDDAFSPSTTTDVDEAEAETDRDLAGARNLYAFSLEAHGVWMQEEREKDPARRWYYQAYGLGDLHGYAQDLAARAVEEFRKREGVWGVDGGRVGLF